MRNRLETDIFLESKALLGCYRPTSTISWKGHNINQDAVVGYYTSLRNKTIELISIDAQPIPDDPNGTCTLLAFFCSNFDLSPILIASNNFLYTI
jgi:hypothetical protein